MRRRLQAAIAVPPTAVAAARRGSRQQLALHGGAAMSTLGMGMVVPILPSYAVSLGATATLVGLLLAAFAATRLLVALPAAWLAGQVGHRWLLVASPAVTVPAALLCAAAGGFWTLAVFCVVEGAMAGTSSVAGNSLVLVDAQAERVGRTVGSFQAAGLAGASLGPVLGGVVGGQLGVPAVFIVYAALAGVTAIWLHLAMDGVDGGIAAETTATLSTDRRAERPAWRVFFARNLWPVWYLGFALTFARIGTQLVAAPVIGAQRLGLNPEAIGLALSLGGFAALAVFYPAGWLADRYGRRAVVVTAGAGIALSLALLALAGDYPEFMMAALLFGVAGGFAGPSPAAQLVDALPVPRRTLGIGVYRSASEIGAVTAPAILGWSVGSGEPNLALLASAALVTTATVSFAWLASGQEPVPKSVPD